MLYLLLHPQGLTSSTLHMLAEFTLFDFHL